MTDKIVDPVNETAAFLSDVQSEKQFSQDSMYFTRDQRVLTNATYGDQPAALKNKNILEEKLIAQTGEVAS